jgi:hypothetical protein
MEQEVRDRMIELLVAAGFTIEERECFTVIEHNGRTQKTVTFRLGELWIAFTETIEE